jgi:hypothetical protein
MYGTSLLAMGHRAENQFGQSAPWSQEISPELTAMEVYLSCITTLNSATGIFTDKVRI